MVFCAQGSNTAGGRLGSGFAAAGPFGESHVRPRIFDDRHGVGSRRPQCNHDTGIKFLPIDTLCQRCRKTAIIQDSLGKAAHINESGLAGGKRFQNLQLTDVRTPIKEAIKLSRVAVRKAGIEIKYNFDDNLPKIYIDSQLVEQVILNMITNAAVAIEEIQTQKQIMISTGKANGYVEIKVSDSGTGIHAEIRDQIFDPFYTTKSDGAGIGLSLCQRIIADHGGTIDVSESISGGAEFTTRLLIEKRKTLL